MVANKKYKGLYVMPANEYLITPECAGANQYEVFFNGEKLGDVRGIIRVSGITELKKELNEEVR